MRKIIILLAVFVIFIATISCMPFYTVTYESGKLHAEIIIKVRKEKEVIPLQGYSIRRNNLFKQNVESDKLSDLNGRLECSFEDSRVKCNVNLFEYLYEFSDRNYCTYSVFYSERKLFDLEMNSDTKGKIELIIPPWGLFLKEDR